MKPIKNQVKELRAQAGLTKEALARALDVSFLTVCRWERGDNIPNAEVFQRIQALAAKEKKGA